MQLTGVMSEPHILGVQRGPAFLSSTLHSFVLLEYLFQGWAGSMYLGWFGKCLGIEGWVSVSADIRFTWGILEPPTLDTFFISPQVTLMGSQHREWFSKAWTHSQKLRFNWEMGTIGRSLCLGCTVEKNDGGLSGKNPSVHLMLL